MWELLLDRDAVLNITVVLGDLSERGVATRQHGHPHRRDYRRSENASSVHCIPPRSRCHAHRRLRHIPMTARVRNYIDFRLARKADIMAAIGPTRSRRP